MLDTVFQPVTNEGQMMTCRFEMYDSERNFIGYCLYSDLARFNHSCDPNAQIVYPFDSMGKRFTRLVATRDIEDGEEVCLGQNDLKAEYQVTISY
jgi:SET and MYND domain-containing protein